MTLARYTLLRPITSAGTEFGSFVVNLCKVVFLRLKTDKKVTVRLPVQGFLSLEYTLMQNYFKTLMRHTNFQEYKQKNLYHKQSKSLNKLSGTPIIRLPDGN